MSLKQQLSQQDRRGPSWGNFFPPLDYKQDLELIEGRECGGITMLKFKRKLHTCDEEDQPITVSFNNKPKLSRI